MDAVRERSVAAEVACEYFAPLARAYGPQARAVGWSEHSQERRLAAIARLVDLGHSSLLDLGCGWGMLRAWMEDHGYSMGRYVGVDVVPELLDFGRARWGATGFIETDIFKLDGQVDGQLDWVVANGVLNLETGHNDTEMIDLLNIAWRCCRRGAVVTFASDWAPGFVRATHIHYYDPYSVLDLARYHTPLVVLDHSYMPHDCAVVMRREMPK